MRLENRASSGPAFPTPNQLTTVSKMKSLILLGTPGPYTVSKLYVVSLAEMEYGAGWSMELDPAGPCG